MGKKEKKHKIFVPFGAFGSPWVIDDGWCDISGHACLGVSQRYAAPLLPGCLALLGADEKSVTEHYIWKTLRRHSHHVIKHSDLFNMGTVSPCIAVASIYVRESYIGAEIITSREHMYWRRDVYGILSLIASLPFPQ